MEHDNYIQISPTRRTRHMHARASRAKNLEQCFVFVVSDLLFPKHVSIIHVKILALVSKKMGRLMDAQKTIAQECMIRLGVAKMGVTKNIKLSTFLRLRACNRIIYSFTTEENLRLQESCASCLSSPHLDARVSLQNRSVRIGGNICIPFMVCTHCVSSLAVRVRPDKHERVTFNGKEGFLNGTEGDDIAVVTNGNTGHISLLPMRHVSFCSFDH